MRIGPTQWKSDQQNQTAIAKDRPSDRTATVKMDQQKETIITLDSLRLEVYEDILESLSSLLSNATNPTSFGSHNEELCSD